MMYLRIKHADVSKKASAGYLLNILCFFFVLVFFCESKRLFLRFSECDAR